MKSKQDKFDIVFGMVLFGVGLLLIFGAPALAACQGFMWLKNGVWPALEIRWVFQFFGAADPVTTWKGLQVIITWVLGLPLTMGMLAVGAIAFSWGLSLEER